jgi:toxin ParE1/3/4
MIARRLGVDDDIAELALYLLEDSGEALATRFIDAVEHTLIDLAKTPGIGSPKSYEDPNLAGVRSWWVKGFPKHLIYYVETAEGICIYAVWHGSRDVERRLSQRERC